MGCDMVVALPRATTDGLTLFGHNSNRPTTEGQSLAWAPGRSYAPGEMVCPSGVSLRQARHTATVLGVCSPGQWGYWAGLNEHQVAAGVTAMRTRLSGLAPGLAGTDLVRLALERSASARQAVDVLTDLIGRHGQALPAAGAAGDCSFLVADGQEAFVLETCGRHWALQSVGEVRAVSDVCQLRQDWDRIAPGLADLAIARGWWPANGSKLDFAAALGGTGADPADSLRRWGRATLHLEQQNGQVQVPFLRRLLSEPGAGQAAGLPPTGTSLVAVLGRDPTHRPVTWCAFGTLCTGPYFPVCLDVEPPAALRADKLEAGCRVWQQMSRLALTPGVPEVLTDLQDRLDQHAQEFTAEALALRQRGDSDGLRRLAGSFLVYAVECWENLAEEMGLDDGRPARTRAGNLTTHPSLPV